MRDFLNKLFNNDWLLIETFSQDFGSKIVNYMGSELNGTEKIETSYYYIDYSKIRNKVRLRKENSNHITKTAYQDAMNYMSAINQDLLLGKSIEDILSEI